MTDTTQPTAPANELQPHQQRVVEERDQLQERTVKLRAFFATETFGSLEKEERDDLVRQSAIMGQYLAVLGRRVERFTKKEPE